jgi:hypothetical protein
MKTKSAEREFMHDLVNQMSMAHGKINRMLMKREQFSEEEIFENLEQAQINLESAFELINQRRVTLTEGIIIK